METVKMINSSGACPSKIMLVGESPTAEELVSGMAFSGYTMKALSAMMTEAGLSLASCFRTHVIRIKAPADDASSFIALKKKEVTYRHVTVHGRQVLPQLRDHIELLKRDIEMCKPNVIIAFGNVALFALTGKWSIDSWRGSIMPTILKTSLPYQPKVVPTYSPRQVYKVYKWRPVCIHDMRKAKRESESYVYTPNVYNFTVLPTFDEVMSILHSLYNQLEDSTTVKRLDVDIETRIGFIECVSLAWSKSDALCIPFMTRDVNRPHYWTEYEEGEIAYLLYKILTAKNIAVGGQNFIYDEQYIIRDYLFRPNLKKDTMIEQHALFSTMPKDLSFQSSMYLPNHLHWKEEGKIGSTEEEREIYNCKDSTCTFALTEAREELVQKMGMQGVVDFQMSLSRPVSRIMQKGVRIDTEKRTRFDAELVELISDREEWLEDVLGYLPNIKSPLQMSTLFYTDLGMKEVRKRGTGGVTTDEEALNTIAKKEPLLSKIVQTITELRSLNVFLNTFIRASLSADNRMKCEYKICGTSTYRFASTANPFGEGTNLQNIPDGKRSTMALPNVRELFIPDEGHEMFDVDLDSADLRIVAWEAGLQEMKDMLAEGKKVYVEVMKEYYKDPTMSKHNKEYVIFKGLCHGTHYLGTSSGLAQTLGLLVHEVDIIQRWYYGKFPGLLSWQQSIKDQVNKRRMVQNIFGYRYYILDRIEGTVYNEAIAWIPQSTVAIIINKALVRLDNRFPSRKFSSCKSLEEFYMPQYDTLLQVHDSLVGQYPIAERDLYIEEIKKATEVILPYNDPTIIPSEIHTSTISWGHCK